MWSAMWFFPWNSLPIFALHIIPILVLSNFDPSVSVAVFLLSFGWKKLSCEIINEDEVRKWKDFDYSNLELCIIVLRSLCDEFRGKLNNVSDTKSHSDSEKQKKLGRHSMYLSL
jgi:hypothetical protein